MLKKTIEKITSLDEKAMAEASKRQGLLAVPPGALGRLHEINVVLAGISGDPLYKIADTGIITMAGDHGVTDQGVSKFPSEVTREMVANFSRGGAAINVLSRHFGHRLTVVDIGVASPLRDIEMKKDESVRLVSARIDNGTKDISNGPAMTREDAVKSLETGIKIVREEYEKGLDAVGTGDMGIGNTTPSAAVAAAFLSRDPRDLVNRGTGIDDKTLEHKIKVVAKSLEVNKPDPSDPIDVLAKVGGYEIGGIAGVILGACSLKIPVVIDGFISTAAAMIASRFDPEIRNYLFSGHKSAVIGHELMLMDLGAGDPLVNLGMRLGEGTGACYGLAIIASASRINREMLTFEEAAVSGPEENR